MRIINALIRTALITSVLLPWNAPATDHLDFNGNLGANKFSANYIEGLLVKSLFDVTQGKLQEALDTIDQLLKTAPNFKLAYLVRGDLLMARAQQLQSFGDAPAGLQETKSQQAMIEDFREEARSRIERYLSQQVANSIPEPLWQLDSSQQYVIVVDTEKSRLYVYRNEAGKPSYIADYYVTLGKNVGEKTAEGDKRTPLGVYFTNGKLSKKLPDFYGDAAYPLSYPNEWDSHQGKRGHGIWLHGTPSTTYSRPPRASDGCVVMTNPDLKSLANILQNGRVPVIISSNLKWLSTNQNSTEKEELTQSLEQWRQDWQAQDTDNYLAHYSSQFFTQSADLTTWAKEKRRIQASKPKVEIRLSNISMFRYPNNQTQMAVVSFDQDYKGNNLDSRIRKRQYWMLENQRWKIIYEGPA
ncbi:MAG TPA: L,D-transpeptidase family protein [Methylophilaceae bacterium]|jgi:murein L,D-transpeptidase YafK